MKKAAEGLNIVLKYIVVNQPKTKRKSKRKQTVYKWLRDHTSVIDFGKKVFDEELGKSKPIHCNKNKDVMCRYFYEKFYIDRMCNRDYDDHLSGKETFYFTGDASRKHPYMISMIDIDCHKFFLFPHRQV